MFGIAIYKNSIRKISTRFFSPSSTDTFTTWDFLSLFVNSDLSLEAWFSMEEVFEMADLFYKKAPFE